MSTGCDGFVFAVSARSRYLEHNQSLLASPPTLFFPFSEIRKQLSLNDPPSESVFDEDGVPASVLCVNFHGSVLGPS